MFERATVPLPDAPAPAAPAIACRGLHKRFGETVAVRALDLEVRRGECFGLLGPNGAGKTTTVEILEGLQRPDAGEVEVLGMRWEHDATAIRARLGVQLQESEFSDRATTEEIVRLFRSFFPRGASVDELIALVQLEEKRGTQVRSLSGGQRQRLSVACALAGAPDVLFLDEPTTGLDPQSRRQLWEVVRGFRARGGNVLLTTHFMDEAERLADRVAVMDHGAIIAQGTPAELIRSLGGDVVAFEASAELSDAVLQAIPTVSRVSRRGGQTRLTAREPHLAIPVLLDRLAAAGAELSALNTHQATLDDVFLTLTGRALRDE
ncbi:MAG TPA: ABC transporter ATP-binding protein [Longimicrobiaceae bacterium]|nr:ABC transporter ATP-binding protein [Longimicrobiaceae bacterium]